MTKNRSHGNINLELEDFLSKVAENGMGIYSAKIQKTAGGYFFDIQLDRFDNEYGSVSIDECEKYSRDVVELIDSTVRDGGEYRALLPEQLTEENYTLQVSSAGAERRLKIPEDLDRFKSKPLRLRYEFEDKRDQILVLYEGFRDVEEIRYYKFNIYVPKSKKAMKRKAKSQETLDNIELRLEQIKEIKLYLEF